MFIHNNLSKTCQNLQSKIDLKIQSLARIELNNIRLGTNKKINYDVFEDLLDYREILEYSKNCSDCLKDIDVISKINKLINTLC